MSKIPDFTPIPSDRQETDAQSKPLHSLAPRKFVQLLAESSQPIYLLDSRSRVRFVNRALADVIGVPQEELLGLECHLRIPPDNQPSRDIASLLAIPSTESMALSEMAITILPLPKKFLEAGSKDFPGVATGTWQSVVVVPLQSKPTSASKVESKSSHKSTVRLCLWSETSSGLALDTAPIGTFSNSRDWNDLELVHSILHQNRVQWARLENLVSLLGNSVLSKGLMCQVQAAIELDTNCLIAGDVGSETSSIAHAIFEHRRQRENRSMASIYTLPVDCRLMDRMLITEMLEMASTYSEQSSIKLREPHRPGNRPLSIDDTRVNLLLDGIDQLASDAVEPLLRFLNQHPQIAVIATASNRDWKQRQDADERLKLSDETPRNELATLIEVMVIDVPPLRKRLEDISVLSEQILEQLRLEHPTKKSKTIGPHLRRWLQSYSWPGNYAELKTALKHAYENSLDPVLQPHDLPLAVRTFASHDLKPQPVPELPLDQVLEEFERSILIRSLAFHQNNRAAAARSLGISRARLLRRLEQLGIDSVSSDMHPNNPLQTTSATARKPEAMLSDDVDLEKEKTSRSRSRDETIEQIINELPSPPDIPDPETPIFESIDE